MCRHRRAVFCAAMHSLEHDDAHQMTSLDFLLLPDYAVTGISRPLIVWIRRDPSQLACREIATVVNATQCDLTHWATNTTNHSTKLDFRLFPSGVSYRCVFRPPGESSRDI